MQLYSTKNPANRVDVITALLRGLADDGGLYMPEKFPEFSSDFFKKLKGRSFHDIAFDIAMAFLKDDIPEHVLRLLIEEAFPFDAPLVKLADDLFVLELFHGPTLAFKDFGARFMARLMGYLIRDHDRDLTVLVATSGDTGSAVAHGFLRVPGIRVILLYPSGRVSQIQEKMLTTMEENVTALEIQGSFDDCQNLVKQAFQDSEITKHLLLTSANSINIGRLIPQSFYYFSAYAQLPPTGHPIVISVPSGNFGHLTAGLFAKKMGLPIARFIAATNANDVIPEYLEKGIYAPRASIQTLSNAMDVGNPSNFSRILDLYGGDVDAMREDIWGVACTDEKTKKTIGEVYQEHRYIVDPHGAVGYFGLQEYRTQHRDPAVGIFFAPAHPAKFLDIVEGVLQKKLDIPERMGEYLSREKKSIILSKDFSAFKQYLLKL